MHRKRIIMKNSHRSVRCLTTCLVALGIAASVQAQGFNWSTASAGSMAMGGVYLPAQGGVIDALTANPAGLALLGSRTLDLSLASVFARGSFSNSANTSAPLNDAPGLIPYGAFGAPIGKSRFSIGVGVVPELVSVSNWNYADAPGVAGASYGLRKQKSAIVAARAVVGVGFALNKKISVGVSAGAVYNSNALETPYVFQSNPALAGLKTLLDLHTSGFGWNKSAGLIASPTDRLQFNVAWKSRTTIDSTGDANGNIGVQLATLGLGAARPDFHYSADVRNILPQSALAGVNWRVDGRWVFAVQADWINWKSSFQSLPVSLTSGNNADINGLLGSSSIFDRVPLDWKDQYSFRGAVERLMTENISLRAGYAHSNNPVPASTLTPLTAAIMTNQLSTGIGYRVGRWQLDLGYGFDPTAKANVGKTAILSGEYANSKVRIGMQSLALNTSFRF
jgi:long-subunit fatty acid transport protein